MFQINEEKCTGCGACINICPQGAISMANNKAIIDRTKCTECQKCYQVCPEGAIYSELQSQYNIPQSQGKGFSDSGFGMDRGMGRGLGKGRGKGLGRGPRDGRGRGIGGGGRK